MLNGEPSVLFLDERVFFVFFIEFLGHLVAPGVLNSGLTLFAFLLALIVITCLAVVILLPVATMLVVMTRLGVADMVVVAAHFAPVIVFMAPISFLD